MTQQTAKGPAMRAKFWLLAGLAMMMPFVLAAEPGADPPVQAGAVPSQCPADFVKSMNVEFYGNFETAGVLMDLPAGIPAWQVGRVRCWLNIGGRWQPVHDLARVGEFPWFATSLFWLRPGTTYQVKAVMEDKAGVALATGYGEGATRQEPRLRESAMQLHVATAGDDANPGTLEKPFKTLQHAFSVADAGTTVLIHGGTYYEGELEFARNGTAQAPIVVKAFNSERVVIDAADPDLMDPSSWKTGDGKIYSHAFTGGCFNASLEDRTTGRVLRLFPVHSLDELKTRTVRTQGGFEKLGIEGGIFCDGATAYLAVPGNLSGYKVFLARQTRAFVIESRRFIQLDGLEIAHAGRGDFGAAAMVMNADDILFQNCRFRLCNAGLWVKGSSSRLTVQDCVFTDILTRWPFQLMKNGEVGIDGQIETGCVYVDHKYSGRGMVIRRNRIAGLFDGAHVSPGSVDDARSNETDFYENVVDDVADDFIETDGITRNVRIFDNRMNRSLSGVSLAQALDGPTFVIYNVLANCGMVSAAQQEGFEGYPFKTNGGPQPEVGSGPVFIYHNTAWTMDPESRAMLIKNACWAKITLRNNIWCGRKEGFVSWQVQLSPMDFDYDDLYVEAADAPLAKISGRAKCMTLDEVRAKTGWLRHGISANPLFADPANGVFTLEDTSPCIDAGVAVAGINDRRMKGKAPDMGAFERR
jgi:hypothetical protein